MNRAIAQRVESLTDSSCKLGTGKRDGVYQPDIDIRPNLQLFCQLSTSSMTSSSMRRTIPASNRNREAFLNSGAAQDVIL